ncbi:hypothetical protein B0T25DRAFT_513304 [Lasiosphaeria hispida]|uniref:RanBP2-type domain-containing protein n=1 Tax=Lasiosphaeria hispida TaxID=260671 RepID=A0AAJ0HV49_9PEZI|nr:hypothetical protein B0T25DRAFT_513304 [Lasiosphaeria hispida]
MLSSLFHRARKPTTQHAEHAPATSANPNTSTHSDDEISTTEARRLQTQRGRLRVRFQIQRRSQLAAPLPLPLPLPTPLPTGTRAERQQRWIGFFIRQPPPAEPRVERPQGRLRGAVDEGSAAAPHPEPRPPTPPPPRRSRLRPPVGSAGNDTGVASAGHLKRQSDVGYLSRDAYWTCCSCSSPNSRWEFLCSQCRVHRKGACCELLEGSWAGGEEVRVKVVRPESSVVDEWVVVEG